MLSSGAATLAHAGGYLTNTNQSVTFLRNPARDAYTTIDAAYSNPAGIGFLSKGWHLGFDQQTAFQKRTIESTFPYYGGGIVNGKMNDGTTKTFKGKAVAPVVPSLSMARIGEKWFASFHFGITGGGGKCKFDESLGSFESQVAMVPELINALIPDVATGYAMDSKMQGRQYYFGGQFGVGYKITDNFNVSVGGRVVYADCNYYGYVRDIRVNTPKGLVPAGTFFEENGLPDFAAIVEDRELNCDQTGWGFTPIVGVDYRIGSVNLAAKYEFRTRMRLKNRAGENTSGIDEFDDGRKNNADIPAILTLGVKYDALESLHLSAGFHYYFDKQAKQVNAKEKNLKSGGWELLAGAEYDVNNRWTVSAGWQTTNYGLGKNSRFISDMSFVANSNSIGLGVRFQLLKKLAINAAYFKTIYSHYNRKQDDYNNIKETFSGMFGPMSAQINGGMEQCNAIINNEGATPEMKEAAGLRLATLKREDAALNIIQNKFPEISTAGADRFHRTNDCFGLGMEIDF